MHEKNMPLSSRPPAPDSVEETDPSSVSLPPGRSPSRRGATAPGDQRAARGEATRARMLAGAMALFAERGYSGASTRALAQAAGSNVALIQFHFGGKRGLYEATLDAVEARLASMVNPLLDALNEELKNGSHARTMAVIQELSQNLLEQLLPNAPMPGFFPLLSRAMQEPGVRSERLWNIFLPLLRGVERALASASSPDLEDRAHMAAFTLVVSVLGVVRGYHAFRSHLSGPRNEKADAATLASLLCVGLPGQFPPPAVSPNSAPSVIHDEARSSSC